MYSFLRERLTVGLVRFASHCEWSIRPKACTCHIAILLSDSKWLQYFKLNILHSINKNVWYPKQYLDTNKRLKLKNKFKLSISVAMPYYFLMREFYQSQQLVEHMYLKHARYLGNNQCHMFFNEHFFSSSLIQFVTWKPNQVAFSLLFLRRKSHSHVCSYNI